MYCNLRLSARAGGFAPVRRHSDFAVRLPFTKGKTQRRHEMMIRLSEIDKERVCFLEAIRRLDEEKRTLEKAVRKLGV
jgi:hypothetical protein